MNWINKKRRLPRKRRLKAMRPERLARHRRLKASRSRTKALPRQRRTLRDTSSPMLGKLLKRSSLNQKKSPLPLNRKKTIQKRTLKRGNLLPSSSNPSKARSPHPPSPLLHHYPHPNLPLYLPQPRTHLSTMILQTRTTEKESGSHPQTSHYTNPARSISFREKALGGKERNRRRPSLWAA